MMYIMIVWFCENIGAKTVPRNHANKNMPYKNSDFTLFFTIKSIENTTKNTIQIT